MLARSLQSDVQYCKGQNWVWRPRNKRDVAFYPDRLIENMKLGGNYAAYM